MPYHAGMQRICVYCGSRPGGRSTYVESARALGAALVERGIGLVYGGAGIGVMAAVADAVLAAGGEAIGVIPSALVERELAHPALSELFVVGSMHERKAKMVDLSDGFIALPGGFGTLDELFEVLTWAQLGMHAKPIGMLDVDGYYRDLFAFIDRAVAEQFVRDKHRDLVLRGSTPAALLDAMAEFQPILLPKWITRQET